MAQRLQHFDPQQALGATAPLHVLCGDVIQDLLRLGCMQCTAGKGVQNLRERRAQCRHHACPNAVAGELFIHIGGILDERYPANRQPKANVGTRHLKEWSVVLQSIALLMMVARGGGLSSDMTIIRGAWMAQMARRESRFMDG